MKLILMSVAAVFLLVLPKFSTARDGVSDFLKYLSPITRAPVR